MKITPHFLEKTKNLKAPFLVFSKAEIRKNYKTVSASFPGVEVYYAMKCEPNPTIVDTLKEEGAGFEVASLSETKQLLGQGVDVKKIICMHPIKSAEFLEFLEKKGIDILAADSYEEIDKIARFAPKSKVVVRVIVDEGGSRWSVNGKFGMEVSEFPKVFHHIKSKGLTPYGLTFHVGSQCENETNWIEAVDLCRDIWDEAAKEGIRLEYISLGGGLAIRYTNPVPEIEKIGALVTNKLKHAFKPMPGFSIEPGRAIVGSAAILATTVFGLAKRGGGKNWAYVETGSYNGLSEAIETKSRKFFELQVINDSKKTKVYTIGGPSCVSFDTPFVDVELPELSVGDRLYALNAGAYNYMSSSPFNGFPLPEIYFLENL